VLVSVLVLVPVLVLVSRQRGTSFWMTEHTVHFLHNHSR
jgi:hypothetical protein